jgi:hypothetical protein
MGSRTVSVLANLDVPDATSEVRAYSREAALKLNVFWKGAYTLDTLIQAATKDLVVTHVPVAQAALEPRDRPRRSGPAYLKRSVATLLRAYALYEPLRTFVVIGGVVCVLGLAGLLRFVYFWLLGDGAGHIQSVTISGVLVIIGFQLGMLGILADVLSVNRQLTEDILLRLKREEMAQKTAGGVAAGPSGSSRD